MNKYYNQSFRLKTEKAIESVNNYEAMQGDFKFKLSQIRDEIIKKHNYRIAKEGEWKKIQLVTGSSELYELYFDQNRRKGREEEDELLLKIVIMNFTGRHIHLSLSTKAEIVKLELCEYKISGEKIIKVKSPIIHHSKTYLTFHSPVDLVVFKMKYDFVFQNEESNRSRLKSSSLQSIKMRRRNQSDERYENSYEKEEIGISLKKIRALSPRSPRSIIMDRSRLESARAETVQKEKEKLALARQKKVSVELYKQKSKSLRNLGHQCSVILSEYKSHIGEVTEKRRELVKIMAILVKAVSFIRDTHNKTVDRNQGLKRAMKSSRMIKKCLNKFMGIVKELRVIQPNRARRELLAIYHHSAQISKTFLAKDINKAKNIIKECLAQTFVGMSLNKAFQCSAAYRGKIRTIQRYWKDRNVAQMTMFKFFLQRHLSELLTKHLYFGLVRDEFFTRDMPFNLSWQYLKESSLKIMNNFHAYDARLKEIKQIKKMNDEIKHYNAKSMKKYQKHLLEVPPQPVSPVFRYFRDLTILKSMLRSWFQIQYRRQVRKLKKGGKSLQKEKK